MESIIFEKKDHVGWITLNRPDQRNALSLELMGQMQEQLDLISKDTDIHVVVIQGNGYAFCTGHNINELMGEKYDINHYQHIFSTCTKLMQTLHELPQPVIAKVHGAALAAGCQLVAACDLAIADTETKFSTPGVKIGLFVQLQWFHSAELLGKEEHLICCLQVDLFQQMKHKNLV